MEDVLSVYTRPRDPDRPVVCLDETSKQLISETRVPIAMKAGRPARVDSFQVALLLVSCFLDRRRRGFRRNSTLRD